MINISEITHTAPKSFKSELQEKIYSVLDELLIKFERVDTDEVITMEDCEEINRKLDMKMVKTLFLCNRQQTKFYLFVTKGDKPFSSKNFSGTLGIARVSFAPPAAMEKMLGTKVGAATVLSGIYDKNNEVSIVFDKEVLSEKYYGCSDGVNTGYLKIITEDVVNKFLPHIKHEPIIIEV